MKPRTAVAVCLWVALMSTIGACGQATKPAAKTAIETVADTVGAGKKTPPDDLTRQRAALLNFPDEWFSTEDLAVRNALLQRSETLLIDLTVSFIDDAVKAQTNNLALQVMPVRKNVLSLTATWPQQFLADFTDVTKEVTTAVACGKILDRLAPTERPAEPGAASDGELAAQEAQTKLAARRWPTAAYQWLVDWSYYVQSVKKDAGQFALNIDGYSTAHIDALGNPGLRKAVLVYLRTCYTPPKSFPVS
jgi:hypothetical protein